MPKKECSDLFRTFAEFTINNHGKTDDGPFNLSHLREELEVWEEENENYGEKGDIHWTMDDISEIESELELIEADDPEAVLTDFVGDE
jgi:hypothetical protein